VRRSDEDSGAMSSLCVEAREAAGMLGVSQRAVCGLDARGDLEARTDGAGAAARLLISVGSVQRLRSERGRRG
jgi:hypothetical protein